MSNSNIEIRKRITALFFVLFLIFVLLLLRLGYLQLVKGTWYQEKALENRIREIVVEPKRGVIYDRNGNELAVSIDAEGCYAIPAEVRKSDKEDEIARELAGILDMEEKDVYELITKDQQSVLKVVKVTSAQRDNSLLAIPGTEFCSCKKSGILIVAAASPRGTETYPPVAKITSGRNSLIMPTPCR
jgi:cell division protein FtsI/penicillin-binding protein 2